jgi:hypothetical protein
VKSWQPSGGRSLIELPAPARPGVWLGPIQASEKSAAACAVVLPPLLRDHVDSATLSPKSLESKRPAVALDSWRRLASIGLLNLRSSYIDLSSL